MKSALEIMDLLSTKHKILYSSFQIGYGGDVSVGADLINEYIFCSNLLPFFNVDSEESGFIKSEFNQNNDLVILDPLDGSSNFISHIPYYGAALTLISNETIKEAFIVNFASGDISYSNLNNSMIFNLRCFRFLNSSKILEKNLEILYNIKCYTVKNIFNQDKNFDENFLSNNLVYLKNNKTINEFNDSLFNLLKVDSNDTFSNIGIFEKSHCNSEFISIFIKEKLKFRSLGAIALSLGFSSLYNFVFIPSNIRKYDLLAGLFISRSLTIFGNVNEYSNMIDMSNVINLESKNKNFLLISNNKEIFSKFLFLSETLA